VVSARSWGNRKARSLADCPRERALASIQLTTSSFIHATAFDDMWRLRSFVNGR
jgi:hypothetical protein